MVSQDRFRSNLYLDVDGVILPYGEAPHYGRSPFEMEALNGLEGYAPEVVRRLGQTSMNLVWCTTWGSRELKEMTQQMDALQDGRQLVLPTANPNVRRITQKLYAIIADQAPSPLPFVWVDDAITANELEIVSEVFASTPHLVIQPDREVGLDEAQLIRVEEFATRFE